VWITLRGEAEALADATTVEARRAGGERLPLAGARLAVKDNIDVAEIPTTAACRPSPHTDRPAPPRSTACTRPGRSCSARPISTSSRPAWSEPAARSAPSATSARPEYAAGGSSSGFGVAVALGIADLALGTDTAGSGRVPAAFQGIVGIKPTRGLVRYTGVVPACRSLDCVSSWRGPRGAEAGLAVIEGLDAADPLGRPRPADAPLTAPPAPRVGAPRRRRFADLTAEARAFRGHRERLAAAGATIVEIDPAPLLRGALL